MSAFNSITTTLESTLINIYHQWKCLITPNNNTILTLQLKCNFYYNSHFTLKFKYISGLSLPPSLSVIPLPISLIVKEINYNSNQHHYYFSNNHKENSNFYYYLHFIFSFKSTSTYTSTSATYISTSTYLLDHQVD